MPKKTIQEKKTLQEKSILGLTADMSSWFNLFCSSIHSHEATPAADTEEETLKAV